MLLYLQPAAGRLEIITDVMSSSDVTIVHSENIKVSSFQKPHLYDGCSWLDNSVWVSECTSNDFFGNLMPIKPYIALVHNHYIDRASTHMDVPGTIFNEKHQFLPQEYTRETAGNTSNPLKHTKLASLLQAYPAKCGHFQHEILPKLVYMLEYIPVDVKFLMSVTDYTKKFVQLLNISHRVVPWGKRFVYFAEDVYFSNVSPFIKSKDPHKGGKTFIFPYSHFVLLKKRLSLSTDRIESGPIVVIKRGVGQPRSIIEADQLNTELQAVFGSRIAIFNASGTLESHIELFNSASLIIGPHGAGFSNIIYCRERTPIVEIGYDSRTNGHTFDNMFEMLAVQTNLEYHLVRGNGTHFSPMTIDVPKVVSFVQNLLRTQ